MNRGQGQWIKTVANMADINSIVWVITFNVNGLNTTIKRQRLSD